MIRKATLKDVDAVVDFMMRAMGDLPYKFANTRDKNVAFELLKKFVLQDGNQYSITNTFVDEQEDKIAGAITAYDGGKIEILRKPFFDFISKNFHQNVFEMELESEAGEFYIDILAVDPSFQGKGLGKNLILTVIEKAKEIGFKKVALLVSASNPNAKRLYEKIGFKTVGYKNLLGTSHEHLVFEI
ncbi:MAG: GNAT family N-acetyltransferase [Pedobacter sp.]|nr:MAG: GNAT family N-acetyltransferase [Pedobacter sp.]